MKLKVENSIQCKFVVISAVLLLAGAWPKAAADLVPLKVLLAYAPTREEIYQHELQLEDRRHNLQLLKFRDQQRGVEAKYSKAMIDCADTPPDDNCAKKAVAEEMRGIKVIQKQEVDENTLHLNNLDKLATSYALGKH
jgi:hypothetical protein